MKICFHWHVRLFVLGFGPEHGKIKVDNTQSLGLGPPTNVSMPYGFPLGLAPTRGSGASPPECFGRSVQEWSTSTLRGSSTETSSRATFSSQQTGQSRYNYYMTGHKCTLFLSKRQMSTISLTDCPNALTYATRPHEHSLELSRL